MSLDLETHLTELTHGEIVALMLVITGLPDPSAQALWTACYIELELRGRLGRIHEAAIDLLIDAIRTIDDQVIDETEAP